MLFKFFVCLVSYFFAVNGSNAQDRRTIGEFTGGEYFYTYPTQARVPTISEGPLPFNFSKFSSLNAPLSEVHNDWPEISNGSIFPYLIEESSSDSFCRFVKNTYKTSCAVICYKENNVPFVIGSGGYVDGSWIRLNEGVVSTARHNFQGRDITQLYVRFYNYEVRKIYRNRLLHVTENYIDVPVRQAMIARNGFDAGILCLHDFPEDLRRKYTHMVSPAIYTDDFATMPDGKYALFHFAGGHHLISVGHIFSPPMGSWINSNVGIEAGDGASGAVMLQKNFRTAAHGISVYRHVNNSGVGRYVERRVIPFSQFNQQAIGDCISAPYQDGNFIVRSALSLASDGYEFLRWMNCKHIDRRHIYDESGRKKPIFEHPDDPEYYLPDPGNMSNHHIIPIDHLLFLWEYVHNDTLDEFTASEIIRSVDKQKVQEDVNNAIRAEQYKQGYDKKKRENDARLRHTDGVFKDEYKERINAEYNKRIKIIYVERVKKRYHPLKKLIKNLTPVCPDKTWFAWSWWNLFKGPKMREDDPSRDRIDKSEKNMPLNFNSNLWRAVKNLDASIKKLIIQSQSRNIKNILMAEDEIKKNLSLLENVWEKPRKIHPYDDREWLVVGKTPGGQFTDKNGRLKKRERKEVYIIKPRSPLSRPLSS